TAGARESETRFVEVGRFLAYVVAGHHSGLPDGGSVADNSSLLGRLHPSRRIPDYASYAAAMDMLQPTTFPSLVSPPGQNGFTLTFFIRMLFSCLVDADSLDSERFQNPEQAKLRGNGPGMIVLEKRLDQYLRELVARSKSTPVNRQRLKILEDCRKAAVHRRGLFSLTVPTGGGKTLSSLAFALKHALEYGLKRVIYVIPFTSIIEQNAAEFRNALGDDAVLEHHSNYRHRDGAEWEVYERKRQLVGENWDAPVIVTTNVQFFESLFAAKRSRCRKLHNLARSVIILDEAQMLPTRYLKACVAAIRELVTNYGSSVVLCTATQPSLDAGSFSGGLENVREIAANPKSLYESFRRVRVKHLGTMADIELAERLSAEERALCIVSTRKAARELFENVRHLAGVFHLSALMYPVHRSQVLKRIRDTLDGVGPCRVVSTALVEAGVDLDFPVVFRSEAGIDSIAQSAGRCNREGRLREPGRVFVFKPERGLPPGWFRRVASIGGQVLGHHEDPLSLDAVSHYFRLLYDVEELDKKGVLRNLSSVTSEYLFPFRTVAESFRFIEAVMEPLIIQRDEKAKNLVGDLRHTEFPRAIARKLQAYTIQIPLRTLNILRANGALEIVNDQFPVLLNDSLYDDELGLCPEEPGIWDIESFVQ
ncbi:MAG: CRISPR-associated helicase Cas3', partial [Thermodesulfobacteriota bacterium]|nr:CRISPR-associated helicase Cas3' [Thermodesulfobacteriota bacterium]